MYDIVVGVDTDVDRALAQAEAITEWPGHEEIHAVLVHVFGNNADQPVESVDAVTEARSLLEEEGIEVTIEGVGGDTAMGLLDMAKRYEANCICVAGRERSPTGKVVFGSVTQDVILGADRPTLVCSTSDGE